MSGQEALRDTVGEPGAQGRVPRTPPGSSHLHPQVGKGAPSTASRRPGGGGHRRAVLGTSGLNIALTLPAPHPSPPRRPGGSRGCSPRQKEAFSQHFLKASLLKLTNSEKMKEGSR